MAEDQDKESKTEEATEKRLRDAIEQGNVPFSRELPTFISLATIVLAGSFMFGTGVVKLANSLARFVDNPADWPLENLADAIFVLRTVGFDAAMLLFPVVLLMMAGGLAGSFLQNAPRFVGDRIQPQLSRISPLGGLSRIFGAMFMDPIGLPALSRGILMRITSWIAGLTLVLVVADLLWSRIHWKSELRMSREELKEELKQSEGRPEVKARMRAIGRARARKRMMAAVPQATLVITNPTHYAVALRYVRSEGGTPKVLAKGADLLALRIREIATKHSIPIVEDKPLARSLHDNVQVDQLIPPQFYKAVAEIIYYLHTRKAQTPHRR